MICLEQQSGDTETLPCSSSSIVKLFLDMNTRSFTERTLRVRNLIGMVKVNRAERRKAKSKKGGKYRGLKRPTDDGVANGGKKRYG